LFAHFHGEAISLSSKPESDINQKSCSQLENPTSTAWTFFVRLHTKVGQSQLATNQSPISIRIYRPDLCFPRTVTSQLSEECHYNEPTSLLFRDSYRNFIFDVKFRRNIVAKWYFRNLIVNRNPICRQAVVATTRTNPPNGTIIRLVANFHGDAISLSFKTDSDISRKIYSRYENPISTVWVFIVPGRNRSLKLALHECCTAHIGASFSWMLDSKLQVPKYVRSKLSHNG